jgi:beta-mannanase
VKKDSIVDYTDCKKILEPRINTIMIFESWSHVRDFPSYLKNLENNKIENLVMTWEPWEPVAFYSSSLDQSKPQELYDNKSIIAGKHDKYIESVAKSIKKFDGSVYIRLAHEPNGGNFKEQVHFYPWSYSPSTYKRSWIHVHDIFKKNKVKNVKFVYSVNPNLYNSNESLFKDGFNVYYPGNEYVDVIGFTVINFGDYPVKNFKTRIELAHILTSKDIILVETNVIFSIREKWLKDLVIYVNGTNYIKGLVFSQGKSKGLFLKGLPEWEMAWDICHDSIAQSEIKKLNNY